MDWARHQYGVFNDQVKKAVESTDRYIGQIMKAVEDIGAAENTNLVLVATRSAEYYKDCKYQCGIKRAWADSCRREW